MLAEVNMLRRQLHVEPASPLDYRLDYEYARLLITPPGLRQGMIWVADSGGFERPFEVGPLAVRGVMQLRAHVRQRPLWVHLTAEELLREGLRMNPEPWVSIDSAEDDYAVWKHTGALYHVTDGAVDDDPIWEPSAD